MSRSLAQRGAAAGPEVLPGAQDNGEEVAEETHQETSGTWQGCGQGVWFRIIRFRIRKEEEKQLCVLPRISMSRTRNGLSAW